MAIRDAIVLNTTGSNFEALQSGDTVRVQGDLLVQDSSGTSLLSVGTSDTTVTLGGSVTSSAVISGSLNSTASFGRFVATTYTGDAREIASTLPRSAGIISASAQIRDDVSGSFTSGFTFGATADQFYVGVSGSNSSHSASVSGSTRGMAASGSDISPLTSDLLIGHIRSGKSTGAWSTGGALSNSQGYSQAAGVQNAALAFGQGGCTEEYNGSTWSDGGALIISRTRAGGGGTQAAAWIAGGSVSPNTQTELYNGSNWAAGSVLINGHKNASGTGTQNSALVFGSNSAPKQQTEEWNGTTWTAGGNLITGREMATGVGLQNAALNIGGNNPSSTLVTCTEHYDGSSWSVGGALLIERGYHAGGAGTESDALVFGGYPAGASSKTYAYDGTTWSDLGVNLPNSSTGVTGTGTATNALRMGTNFGPWSTCVHEYDAVYTSTGSFGRVEAGYILGSGEDIKGQIPRDAGLVTSSAQLADDISGSFTSGFNFGGGRSVFTGVSGSTPSPGVSGSESHYSSSVAHLSLIDESGAVSGSDYSFQLVDEVGHIKGVVEAGVWTLGPNINNPRQDNAGAGVQNAALSFGGYPPSVATSTEIYDGTTWSELNDLNLGRGSGGGLGTVNAALYMGGQPTISCTEEWNGTSWSEVTNMTTARANNQGVGTQNAGLIFGGNPRIATTEEYNGTSFSTGGSLITAIYGAGGAGIQNAALKFGGANPSADNTTEHYNGTSWTAGGNLITARFYLKGAGTENSAMAVLGYPAAGTITEHYDGSSWSAGGSLNIARSSGAATGVSHAAIAMGGAPATSQRESTELYEGSFSNSGSFGRIEAKLVTGDITDLQSFIERSDNVVSGSSQLAEDVSGSFTSGFNFGHTFESRLTGISGSNPTPGVSGSEAHYSSSVGHPTVISVSGATSGSDYDIFANSGIRGSVINGTWRSGGTMITPRYRAYKGGTGVENAAIVVGSGPSEYSNDGPTEKYNGTSWSADGSGLNTTLRFSSLTGTQNAALSVGGLQTWTGKKNVEIYNGNVWTATQDLPETSGSHIVFGTVNAASAVGMMTQDSANNTYVYNFNGTSWSTPRVNVEVAVAGPGITGTHDGMAGGSQNAGISAAGYVTGTGVLNKAFTFDGTTFTQVGNLNTARTGVGGWGTANTALVVGGVSPGATSKTELWDGTAWSETTDAANSGGRGGGSAGNFADAGISTPGLGYTEHWDGGFQNTGSFGRVEATYFDGDASDLSSSLGLIESVATIASDISGSFSSGFNIAVRKPGSAKDLINDEGAILTDPTRWCWTSASFNDPQEYLLRSTLKPRGHFQVDRRHTNAGSGSLATWSQGTPLIHRKRTLLGGSTGPRDAIMLVGAGFGEYGGCARTELYDGVAWYEGKYQNNQRRGKVAFGTQNAGVAHGGRVTHTYKNDTEEWDGISWTTVISHDNAVSCSLNGIGFGTQNDGLVVSFASGSPASYQDICHYDGTTFSRGAEMVYSINSAGGAGDADCAIVFGGTPSANRKLSQEYNGTVWAQRANLSYPATGKSGAGENYRSSCQALGFGGLNPGLRTQTEVHDSTLNTWSTTAYLINSRANHGVQAGNNQSAYAVGGYFPGPTMDNANIGTLNVEYYDEQLIGTGSFGSVIAGEFWGDGTGVSASLFSKILSGSLSSSAQIADDISGSWSSGIVAKGDIVPHITDGVWSTVNQVPGRSSNNNAAGGCFRSNTMFGSGLTPSPSVQHKDTWLYNDVSWRAAGELYTQTNPTYNAEIVGGETMFMFLGGDSYLDRNQIYDGNAWYANACLPNPHSFANSVAGAGDPKAETHVTGISPSCSNLHLIWNTLAWSVGPGMSMSQAAHNAVGGGSAVFNYAGCTTPGGGCEISQQWDGSTWSNSQPLPIGVRNAAGFGTGVNDAVINGSCNNAAPSFPATGTQIWNGTTWKIGNPSSFARKIPNNFGGGTGTRGLAIGNQPTPSGFEEFNVYYNNDATGSFGAIQPKSTFRVSNFTATGSVFRLPIFNEHDTSAHYFVSRSKQPGEMWFNKSRNSIFYTWESSSISTSMCGSSGQGDPNNQYTQSIKVSTIITSQISSSRYTGSWGEIEQEYI